MTTLLVAFFVFYIWYVGGITLGYHRLLAHRSYKCNILFEYFWVLGGYLAYQGSPIWWTSMHRAHHKHADTPLDPHSPAFGIFKGYAGWLLKHTTSYPSHIIPREQCKDLYHDKLYVFLEQDGKPYRARTLSNVMYLGFHSSMIMLFGWQIGVGSLLASMVAFQIPLILNTACHIPKLGYKGFSTGDDSVNVWWLGIIALGEGWHNNHHAFPGSSRAGVLPHEFDFSWHILQLGKLTGLVTETQEPKEIKLRLNRRRKHAALSRYRRIKESRIRTSRDGCLQMQIAERAGQPAHLVGLDKLETARVEAPAPTALVNE